MLAVIDTNIWISAVLTPDGFCSPVVDAVRASRFAPVVCPAMQRELTVVLTRPRLVREYSLTAMDIARVVRATMERGVHLDDPQIVPVCRDPHDDLLVALAAAARADCLVTRDDDLKGDEAVRTYLEPFGVRVVSVREFLALLESTG